MRRFAMNGLVGALVVAVVSIAGSAGAETILNCQFSGSQAPSSSINYTGLGAYTAGTGTSWNHLDTSAGYGGVFNGTFSSLLYSDGTTSFSVGSVTIADAHDATLGTLNIKLFAGHLNPGGGATLPTVTISGLTASDTYALYVYAGRDATVTSWGGAQNTKFTVTGGGGASSATTNFTANNSTTAFNLGYNYLVFSNLSPTVGKTISFTIGVPSSGDGYCNGFQLIDTTPEPSTLALLAAGLIGLLCYAWRKRR